MPVQDCVEVNTALISVFDKSGLPEFVGKLVRINPRLRIISSGGTYKTLQKAGYNVTAVEDYTGFPESPGGLVKTLHPAVHGGLLLDPSVDDHASYMANNGIIPIDLVVVNLYPFRRKVEEGASIEEIRENIDIGGPTMIRAAAKNFKRVAVVVDPNDYKQLLEELGTSGQTRLQTRVELASKAFDHTAEYDTAINDFFVLHTVPRAVAEYYLKGQKE